jgi:hypothetical protein
MFDHRNFALMGLFPGLVTHRSIANLGHFEIEITIEPQPSGGGGGGFYRPTGAGTDKYKIRIRVTRKGRVWEFEKIVGSTMAKVLAKVIKKKVAEPSVIATVNNRINESAAPEIKVTHVNRKN